MRKNVVLLILITLLFTTSNIVGAEHININNSDLISFMDKSPKLGNLPDSLIDLQNAVEELDDIYTKLPYLKVYDKNGTVINDDLVKLKETYEADKFNVVEDIYTRILKTEIRLEVSPLYYETYKGTIKIYIYLSSTYLGYISTTISADKVDGVMSTFGSIKAYSVKNDYATKKGYSFYLGEKTMPWLHKHGPVVYRFTARPYVRKPGINHNFLVDNYSYIGNDTFDVTVN